MKGPVKALVAAVVLAAAGSANAAIDKSTTGNGELFFTIWNTTTGVKSTYVQDLGIKMNDFDGRTNLSFNLAGDTNWTSFLSSYAAINPTTGLAYDATGAKNVWMIGAMDSTDSASTGGTRVLSTSNSTATQMANQTNSNLNDFSIADNFLALVNQKGTHLTQANGSSVAVAADGTALYAGSGSHNMQSWEGKAQGWTSSANQATALSFYSVVNSNGDEPGNTPTFTKFVDDLGVAQKWSVNIAGNSLDWNAGTIVATPIPAAAWLLGSALLGLVGVGRRQSKANLIAA